MPWMMVIAILKAAAIKAKVLLTGRSSTYSRMVSGISLIRITK